MLEKTAHIIPTRGDSATATVTVTFTVNVTVQGMHSSGWTFFPGQTPFFVDFVEGADRDFCISWTAELCEEKRRGKRIGREGKRKGEEKKEEKRNLLSDHLSDFRAYNAKVSELTTYLGIHF